MQLPNGIARKIYLIITIVITIPLLIFSYFDSLRLKDLLVEKRTQKVLEVASTLEDSLDMSFDSILTAKNATKLSKKEQVQVLNQQLQPLVIETASRYPGYGVGFYSHRLDSIVAVATGSKFNPNLLGKPVKNQLKLRLYETGKMQTGYIQNGFTWKNGTPILALNYPIYREGKLIGHAWANTRISDIMGEFYLALLKRFLITILIWLILSAIIWYLFRRLEEALTNLTLQIQNQDYQIEAFKDFPSLLPVLGTIIDLRKKLKKESNILHWMLETIPGGIIVLNNKQQIILANNSAHKLLDLDPGKNKLLGKDLEYLCRVTNIENKTNSPFFQVLKNSKFFHREKFHLNDRVIQFDASPIIDPQTSKQLGAASYFDDITEEEIRSKEILKMKEKYLIESTNLRQLIDAAPLGVVAINKEKNITAINKTFLSWYPQFTYKDLIGKSFKMVIEFKGTKEEHSPIIQALEGQEVHDYILEFKSKKVLINAYPIKKIGSEEILGAISLGQDITEVEENKKTLEDQAQLLNLAQDYILVRDMNGKIIFWNKGAEIGYGWRKEEALGKNYHQLLNTKFLKPKEEIEKKLIEKGYWTGELIHTGKNKIEVIVESHWTLKINDFGEPEAILEINHDITQLKQNQERESQLKNQYMNQVEKLNQLIEICPISILALDCQGKIVALNQAFLSLLPRFKKADLVGQTYQLITKYLGANYEKAPVIRALKGEEVRNSHLRFLEKDWLCNALPLRDSATGQIIGAISIYHDITMHEQIRTEMSRLDSLNLIGEMAASVAHEVRNPMTAARGYLQLIMAKSGKEFEKQFRIVLEELDRANSIITDFLSLARDKSSEKKEQNLNDIIINISPLIYGDAIKKEVNVKLDLADDLPNLYLDDKEIKQLILNFSRNALEAMKEKGILTITTRKQANQVQLSIADTGCGIPQEQLARIFDPFYTTKSNGTGLGLGVCLGIIKRHQGVIEVQSQEGVGTTFTIAFNPTEASDNLAS